MSECMGFAGRQPDLSQQLTHQDLFVPSCSTPIINPEQSMCQSLQNCGFELLSLHGKRSERHLCQRVIG